MGMHFGVSILGPELVKETTEKVKVIKSHLLTAQNPHKSYADRRRRPLEFVGGRPCVSQGQPSKWPFTV